MREYPRNVVLLETLKGVHKTKEVDVATPKLFGVCALLWQERAKHDAVLLIHPTKDFVFPMLIMRPFWGGKIIGDAFTSVYDTLVNDRALAGKKSIKALYYFLLDWVLIRFSDILFFDTEEHKAYFQSTFGLGARKSYVIPVTVDVDRLAAITAKQLPEHKDGMFEILFCGYFIPLQGIEFIVGAADQLRNETGIRFTLLGSGQTRPDIEKLVHERNLTNLQFLDRVPYEDLLAYTKGTNLSLGIFGKSEKAGRVVANKIIESLAVGVPLVTGRSPAVERFLTDGVNVFFAEMANADDLAKTILRAYNTKELQAIAKAGQEVARTHFSTTNLARILTPLE